MRAQQVSLASVTTSSKLPMDNTQAAFAVGFGVVFTGTATAKVQFTFDDPDDSQNPVAVGSETWFDHPIVAGVTTNTAGNFAFPVKAIRLNVTAFTNGTVTLRVLQGSKAG